MDSNFDATRIERNIWLTFVGTNLFGVLVLSVGALLGRPVFPDPDHKLNRMVFTIIASGVVWFLLAAALSRFQVHRIVAPTIRWRAEQRSPTPLEQSRLYRIPTAVVLAAVGWWIAPGLWAPPLGRWVGYTVPPHLLWKAEGLLILSFSFASALGFLLVERQLRPVFADALRSDTPLEPVGLNLTRRLFIVWFAVAAAPLFAVGIEPIGASAAERANIWGAVMVVTVGGLAGGAVIVLLAARSIQEPLHVLRAAIRRVERGELDVEIEVADASEIGLVQAGFNRMVESVRERARLRELFGHHVGADVAAQALLGEPRLGGEMRDVSVLFVDVVGSTSLAQREQPTVVVEKLNAFFDAVVKAVDAEGGWVNKFEGDAALCVFGAPNDLDDHAGCALRAAVRIRAALVHLRGRYPDIDAAVGVSSGEVVAGNIGAEQRYEYTVIGDPVNEASRITDEAKGTAGRVLASGSSVAAANGTTAQWRRVDERTLRGRATPTTLYEPA